MKKICVALILVWAVVILGTVTKIETANAYPLNPQAPIVFGGDLHMVESADFNQDGKNDLVVTDGKTFRGIGLLYGNGNGTFSAPVIIGDSETYEYGLKVADLNNDTWTDIVVGNGDFSKLQVYINDGTGNFLPETHVSIPDIGNGRGNLDVADVNGDGYNDIAVPAANDAFHLLLNDGAGNFPTITSFAGSGSSQHEELSIGDLNNDENVDVAVTSADIQLVEVFYGDGNGNFAFDHSFSADAPHGILIKDVDNDSINEIIYTQLTSNQDVVITDESGSVKYLIPASSAVYVRADDINVDGNVDIIFSDASVPGIKVALGVNGGGFDIPVDYYVNSAPLGLTIKDFDGDNLPDVAAVNHGETLSIFLTAAPLTTPGVTITGSPAAVEGGANGQVQVVLDSNPSDVVFVTFVSRTGQSAFPNTDTLCFVPTGMTVNPGTPNDPCSTWNVGQTMTISANDDVDVEGIHSDVAEIHVASSDSNYSGLNVPFVDVTIYDNEVPVNPALKITTLHNEDQIYVNEQGPTSDTYEISLEGIPSSNVSISCAPTVSGQVSFSPTLTNFIVTPLNAHIPKSFTVTAIDDAVVEGDENIALDCSTSSNDQSYSGLTYRIGINISDNDVAPTDTDGDSDPDTSDPDDDGDNISDLVEGTAPNVGDANGDTIADSLQNNVSSAPSEVTGEYMSLELGTSSCTQIELYSTNSEDDNANLDAEFEYPVGFTNFTVSCTNPGDTAQINWVLDDQYDTSDWEYRKFHPNNSQYSEIVDVTYSTRNVGGVQKTVVTYEVTDGSSLDDDGSVDASISDPSGPAVFVAATPTTTTTSPAPTPTPTATTSPSGQASAQGSTSAQGSLPTTGADSAPIALNAFVIVLVGAGIVFAAKRKRSRFSI